MRQYPRAASPLIIAIALALLAAALYMSRSRWLDDELANLAVEAHS